MNKGMETEVIKYNCTRNDCSLYHVLIKVPQDSITSSMRCAICKTPLTQLGKLTY